MILFMQALEVFSLFSIIKQLKVVRGFKDVKNKRAKEFLIFFCLKIIWQKDTV